MVMLSSSCRSQWSTRSTAANPVQGKKLALPDEHGAVAELTAERHSGVSGEVPQAGTQGEDTASGVQYSSVRRRGQENI